MSDSEPRARCKDLVRSSCRNDQHGKVRIWSAYCMNHTENGRTKDPFNETYESDCVDKLGTTGGSSVMTDCEV
jgi:hypothetical protein